MSTQYMFVPVMKHGYSGSLDSLPQYPNNVNRNQYHITTRLNTNTHLGGLGLAAGSLVQVVSGKASTPQLQVQRGPHLIELNPRRTRARLLQQDPKQTHGSCDMSLKPLLVSKSAVKDRGRRLESDLIEGPCPYTSNLLSRGGFAFNWTRLN